MVILLKKRKRSKFFIGLEISKDDSYGEFFFRYEVEINKKQYLELIQDLLSLTSISCIKKDIKTEHMQDNIEENVYTKYIVPIYKAQDMFYDKQFINVFYERANLALNSKIQDCKKEDLDNISFYILAPRRVLNRKTRKKFRDKNFENSILIEAKCKDNTTFEYRIYNEKHVKSYIDALRCYKKSKKINKYYKLDNQYKKLDVYIYTLNKKEAIKLMENIKLPYKYLYNSPHTDRLLAFVQDKKNRGLDIFEINIPVKLMELK